MIGRQCIAGSILFVLGAFGFIEHLSGQVLGQSSAQMAQGLAVDDLDHAPHRTQVGDHRLDQLITKWVLGQMPHVYQRDKNWGNQVERWDGIKWDTKGGRILTKRRKKMVNHGTWRQYSAELLDPRQQFSVRLTNVRKTPDDRLAFRLEFQSKVKLLARQSEWLKGVQIYSLSAEGKAKVHLMVEMSLDIQLDPSTFPPDLIFSPSAESADIVVSEFRIDRISKVGGEFAEQVTRLARHELDQVIAKKKIELVEKINHEIEEEKDQLRISLAEALNSKWAEQVEPHLPIRIKKAVGQVP